MAIVQGSERKQAVTTKGVAPLEVIVDQFNGTPMLRVQPYGVESVKTGINVSMRKWQFLFENDHDGDNILAAVFGEVLKHAKDDAERARLKANAVKFAESLLSE